MMRLSIYLQSCLGFALFSVLIGCAEELPSPPNDAAAASVPAATYEIGPLDQLQIFVWRAEDLSVDVPVRPDGPCVVAADW